MKPQFCKVSQPVRVLLRLFLVALTVYLGWRIVPEWIAAGFFYLCAGICLTIAGIFFCAICGAVTLIGYLIERILVWTGLGICELIFWCRGRREVQKPTPPMAQQEPDRTAGFYCSWLDKGAHR